MKDLLKNLDGVSRREFAKYAAKTFLGVSLLPVGGASLALAADEDKPKEPTPRKNPAKNIIYLYMNGGMTHLDTLDPKPGAETQGPVQAIDTSVNGIQISEFLPRTARHMNKIALIPGMHTTQGAHEQAQYLLHTSYVKRGTISHPCLGSWVGRLSGKINSTLPSNVSISGGSNIVGSGYMESRYSPLPIGNPATGLQDSMLPDYVSEDQFQSRLHMAEKMNASFRKKYNHKDVRAYTAMYSEAVKLMNSADLKAFDINREPDYLLDAYGEHAFGKGCLLARRLIENNVRFVEVNLGGWDTHNDNFDRVPEQAEILDVGLATLLEDLTMRGLLESTLVVLGTDFGRTPDIDTGRKGRNHYPKAYTCLMAGAGVAGGQRYGKTDEKGKAPEEKPVRVVDFNATIAYLMGLPLDKVITSPSKRPFTIADKGQPIHGIIA